MNFSGEIIINYIAGIPLKVKLAVSAGVILYIAYKIIKQRKELPPGPFEKEYGNEWRRNEHELKDTIHTIQNPNISELLSDTYRIAHRIYKRVIKLDNNTVQDKLNPKLNADIIRFETQQLSLLTQLLQNYINIEKKITYTASGDMVFEDDNQHDSYGMKAIENELSIINISFKKLYNRIETAVNGKWARLVPVSDKQFDSMDGQNETDTADKKGADMAEIYNIIMTLNRNIGHTEELS